MSAFCKFCGGAFVLLGIMGRREYVKCQSCGLIESRKVEVLR
jgi:hypothetical protein